MGLYIQGNWIQFDNEDIVIRYKVYIEQHPSAGRNTQHVHYEEQARAGRNT